MYGTAAVALAPHTCAVILLLLLLSLAHCPVVPVPSPDTPGKCSALVKVTADLSDLVFGHSTFDSFTAMTRIYKHYQLHLKQVCMHYVSAAVCHCVHCLVVCCGVLRCFLCVVMWLQQPARVFTLKSACPCHVCAMCAQVSGGVAAQQLSFSSYPGELFSDDDMYITSRWVGGCT